MEVLLALHALATIMLAGLIWFVQLVHYPLFSFVGAGDFVRYEREHTRRVLWIVAPLMSLEAVTAVTLVFMVAGAAPQALAIAGILLVAAIWASTAFLQVPCHRKLAAGYDELAENAGLDSSRLPRSRDAGDDATMKVKRSQGDSCPRPTPAEELEADVGRTPWSD